MLSAQRYISAVIFSAPLNTGLLLFFIVTRSPLWHYRTIIVEQARRQIFRQIAKYDEVILAYFEEFLAKMTRNLQAIADKARRAVMPYFFPASGGEKIGKNG